MRGAAAGGCEQLSVVQIVKAQMVLQGWPGHMYGSGEAGGSRGGWHLPPRAQLGSKTAWRVAAQGYGTQFCPPAIVLCPKRSTRVMPSASRAVTLSTDLALVLPNKLNKRACCDCST